MADVAENYRRIMETIGEAAAKSGRNPKAVRLLAASKAQSVELIRMAISAGVSLIGENYVQEAQRKKKEISEVVEWHMIGHLQRNKAKVAVELFDLIETLDSLALAKELDREGHRKGEIIRVFVEVNLAGEESKSGVTKDRLVELVRGVGEFSHVRIEGLMTVPPFRENLEAVRPYFKELRALQESLNNLAVPNVDLKELSMGMTHDYRVAVEEGATIVRIGTALLGPRKS
jgi:hypothetical protein